MTRGGRAYELPTSALPTGESGYSSSPLLRPTPTTPSGGQTIPDDATWSGNAAYRADGSKVTVPLAGVVEWLLPTPRAQNGEDRNSKPWYRPDGQPQNLENALARVPEVQRLIGASTPPQSADGNAPSDAPPPPPSTNADDSTPTSPSG